MMDIILLNINFESWKRFGDKFSNYVLQKYKDTI